MTNVSLNVSAPQQNNRLPNNTETSTMRGRSITLSSEPKPQIIQFAVVSVAAVVLAGAAAYFMSKGSSSNLEQSKIEPKVAPVIAFNETLHGVCGPIEIAQEQVKVAEMQARVAQVRQRKAQEKTLDTIENQLNEKPCPSFHLITTEALYFKVDEQDIASDELDEAAAILTKKPKQVDIQTKNERSRNRKINNFKKVANEQINEFKTFSIEKKKQLDLIKPDCKNFDSCERIESIYNKLTACDVNLEIANIKKNPKL